jgi:glucose/mannose-6-phosphate isomerase
LLKIWLNKMMVLDNIEEIKKLDAGGVLSTVKRLDEQVGQAWNEILALHIPEEYKNAQNIVLSGMGGSALGGRIVDALTNSIIRAPFEISTEYGIPNYVNTNTLLILSSYSGNTAETISAANEGLKKGAKIIVVATGGKLADFAKENNLPAYIYVPKENPSNQPRMALGYSITAIVAVLNKLGFISLTDMEIKSIIQLMGEKCSEYSEDVLSQNNLAKLMAEKIKSHVPVLVASEHLVGSIHAFKNQLNENSKTFALSFDIPELNHHLMEGLKFPPQIKETLLFIFINSDLYSDEIKKRYPITEEVVNKNEIKTFNLKLTGKSKLEQIYELLVFGSFVSFYIAVLYGIDPTPIPWVDYFKNKLS